MSYGCSSALNWNWTDEVQFKCDECFQPGYLLHTLLLLRLPAHTAVPQHREAGGLWLHHHAHRGTWALPVIHRAECKLISCGFPFIPSLSCLEWNSECSNIPGSSCLSFGSYWQALCHKKFVYGSVFAALYVPPLCHNFISLWSVKQCYWGFIEAFHRWKTDWNK